MTVLRAARDTFLHFISDNLPDGVTVHAMRRDPNDRAADTFAMNSVNIEFLNFGLGAGQVLSTHQAVIDVINDTENTVVDWVEIVWGLLKATFFIPILDYTDPANPAHVGRSLCWDSRKVSFKKIASEGYSHFTCTLSLQFSSI